MAYVRISSGAQFPAEKTTVSLKVEDFDAGDYGVGSVDGESSIVGHSQGCPTDDPRAIRRIFESSENIPGFFE